MRYPLRTLLIVLAVGPPLLAGAWVWTADIQKARDIAALEAAIENYRTHPPGDFSPRQLP